MIKVITICGSMRFADEMEKEAERLTEHGYVVKLPIKNGRDKYTESELEAMHREKILSSDAILVFNIGGYIGDSTRKEIQYAEYKGVDVLYKEEEDNNGTDEEENNES